MSFVGRYNSAGRYLQNAQHRNASMNSSFSDQPSPRKPLPEDAYTPTPPSPERECEADADRDADLPKLGSLAQKARSNKLRQARIILFLIGGFSALVNGGLLLATPSLVKKEIAQEVAKQGGLRQVDPVLVEKATNELLTINYATHGAFFCVSLLFLVLGFLVYRFPVPATILGLVLYLLALLAGAAVTAISDDAENVGKYLASGWLIRVIIIVALASSIKAAVAYENERRAESEFAPAE